MTCIALALTGCQGGGANPPPFNSGSPAPVQATQSQTVTPSGGSVSTTLGTQTVKVIVPPGALSGPATVTVTVYANSAAPKALQSGARKVRTIGSGAALITEFSVAVSGATLLKPLQASLTTPAATAGSIFRLAGFGTSFDDVDTVTYAGGQATSDLNIAYPRMSLATPPGGTIYAFYTEPAASASAAPTPVITVTPAPANPVPMFGTATFSASEASPNGFPYLDTTFTYALDNNTIGSITPAGVFTAGAADGVGNVTATDTTAGRGNPHGAGQVTVTSQRPGNTGDTFNFTGTLKSVIQLVNRNPTVPQVDQANVTLTSTATSSSQQSGGGLSGVVAQSNSTETDVYPLQTITTKTLNAMGWTTPSGGHSTVLNLGSQATDSNGSTYTTQPDVQNGNGIIDVLPETAGPFGPNTAALAYNEDDPAKFHRDRTVATTGAYVEHGTDALGDLQTITVNANLSASYDARQYSGLAFTMTAPSGTPKTIVVRVFNSAGTQIAAISTPSWIPASMTQPSTETDTDNGSQPFPAACAVPSKYGTSGNQIVQTINRVDPAFGNLEVLTTTTYLAPRVGPVCIQMTDSVKTFYDFTGQDGFSLLVGGGTTDLQETTLSETLTLQSASTDGGTYTTSTARGTKAVSTNAFAPAAFARARFEHAVRMKLGLMRTQTFSHDFGSKGVKAL